MKQLIIFCLFCLTLFSFNAHSLTAQTSSANQTKKDTTQTAILAGHTQSLTDCGNDPSSEDDKPVFIIIIEEIEPIQPDDSGIAGSGMGSGTGMTRKKARSNTSTSYFGKVKAEVTAPFQQKYSFDFLHKEKGKNSIVRPKWELIAHCDVERVNISLNLQYGGEITKALFPKSNSPQKPKTLYFNFNKRTVKMPNGQIKSFKDKLTIGGENGKVRISVKK